MVNPGDFSRPLPTISPVRKKPIGLRVRIDLLDTEEPVWRQLEVSGDVKLSDFHHYLQASMGWTNSHLHKFHQGRESGFAWFVTEWDKLEGEEGVDEADVRLDQVLSAPGDKLYYDYDFGDNWDHLVVVESVLDSPPAVPTCVAGQGACPPEDCGGTYAYESLAEWARGGFATEANPGPLAAWEMRRWLPPGWHPDTFSAEEVSTALVIEASSPVVVEGELGQLAANLEASGVRVLRNLLARPAWQGPAEVTAEEAAALTEPYRLMLEVIGAGVKLTPAGYLPTKLVGRFAEESGITQWWSGKVTREDLTAPVADVRSTAQALGLIAKRKGQLEPTAAGRRGMNDPLFLWRHIVARIPMGREPGDSHAGWMALVVTGAEVPPDKWFSTVQSLLGLLGWQSTMGDEIVAPAPFSPTLDVLEILGGVKTSGERTEVNAALGATARSVVLASRTTS